MFIFFVVILIGGGNFFLFATYTGGFNRRGLWVFFALGMLACLMVLRFMLRLVFALVMKREHNKNRGQEAKLVTALNYVRKRYKYFTDVDGKYYLIKIYAAEYLEHVQQIFSLNNIYLCVMPVKLSTIWNEKRSMPSFRRPKDKPRSLSTFSFFLVFA